MEKLREGDAALANELRLMEAGICRTEQRILEFEQKYHLGSQDFIAHYENDEMEENMNFDEWIAALRLLERLREKVTLCDLCLPRRSGRSYWGGFADKG